MSGFRFVHVGVALCLGAAGVTSVQLVGADGPPGTASAFVPITPCRLADTRPGDLVGSRAVPVGAQEVVQFAVWGSNGNCSIPSTATGIATNVTTVNPNANSYLTVFPADAAQPLTSNLNWTPSSPPTPNQVTVGLSAGGAIKVFNNAGTIDVIIDIVGYYVASTSGPAGPPGPPGANGTNGTNGVVPAKVIWVATAGGDFTNIDAALASISGNSSSNRFVIKVAPGTYMIANTVVLKDYVDIEGSGEDTTEITCACGTNTSPSVSGSSATVRAESNINAEVRNITINNTGLNQYATAIWTGGTGAGTVKFTHVTANVSGNAANSVFAIYINGNRTDLTDVTASASTSVAAPAVTGVFVSGAGPVSLSNVVASAAGASVATAGVLFGSSLGGTVNGLRATATGAGGQASGLGLDSTSNVSIDDSTMSASNSVGGISVGLAGGGPSPAGVNRITNSTGSGVAGTSGYAVGMYFTNGSSAVLTDITATGVGGLDTLGLVLQDTSAAVVNSATAAASGGTSTNTGTLLRNGSPSVSNLNTSATGAGSADAAGLDFIIAGSPTLRNVDARATGSANVFGIRVNASGTLIGNTISATATGGALVAGVDVAAGSVDMANLTADGGTGTGLYTPGAVVAVVVRNSSMSGIADSVNRVSGTMKISNSHLSKPALGVPAGSCINVINDATGALFVNPNSNCT